MRTWKPGSEHQLDDLVQADENENSDCPTKKPWLPREEVRFDDLDEVPLWRDPARVPFILIWIAIIGSILMFATLACLQALGHTLPDPAWLGITAWMGGVVALAALTRGRRGS